MPRIDDQPAGSTTSHDSAINQGARIIATPLASRRVSSLLAGRQDRWMFVVYLASVVVVVVIQARTRIDFNFEIFRRSFAHLRNGSDLYAPYAGEQTDLFKYSPTFAFLFGPFALLPALPALFVWNTTNVLAMWYATRRTFPSHEANFVLAVIFIEVVHSTQRAQSNVLVTALMVLAFALMEERRQVAASSAIVIATSIKLFPILAVVPALFHPRRSRMTVVMLLVSAIAMLLPLFLTNAPILLKQYASWYTRERIDAAAGVTGGAAGLYGGAMHWVRLALNVSWPNGPIQLAGLFFLLAPLIRATEWGDANFRLRVLSSLLLFATIFNPQVESPSFVIAMTGAAIWYIASERRALEKILLALAFAIISVAPSGVFSQSVGDFVVAHKLKVLPCLVLWIVIQYQLIRTRNARA